MVFRSVLTFLFAITGFLLSPASDRLLFASDFPEYDSVDTLKTFLPIVLIQTNGIEIPDEPKILARMGVIHNSLGDQNTSTDPFNEYDGFIGIERRGSTSQQLFPKLSFAVETRTPSGEDQDVELLGMPEEEDWVLYAPYSDKSLLRNMLALHIARSMGRYASRTQPVELFINGHYEGVYILLEKVKRDKHRVNVAKLDEDDTDEEQLTGGYIIKIDKLTGSKTQGWQSEFPPFPGSRAEIFYQFEYPDQDDITFEQRAYLRDFVKNFERTLDSDSWDDPISGYSSLLDVDATIDYILVNEVARNVDAYRLSTFLHKDRDNRGNGKLVPGPVWDFNIAFGNADYYSGSAPRGWVLFEPYFFGESFQRPFWWEKIWSDPLFQQNLSLRWEQLRSGPLHTDSLLQYIADTESLLLEPAQRNFERWPILFEHIWPNAYVGGSFENEVEYVRSFLMDRLNWMDSEIEQLATRIQPFDVSFGNPEINLYPNPVSSSATLTFASSIDDRISIRIFDSLGRRVKDVFDGNLSGSSVHRWFLNTSPFNSGLYFVRIEGHSYHKTVPFIRIR